MDATVSPGDTIPERRTKSWRREHQETCRRYLSCQSNTPKVPCAFTLDNSAERLETADLLENEEGFKDTINSGTNYIPCCDIDVTGSVDAYTKRDEQWKHENLNSVKNPDHKVDYDCEVELNLSIPNKNKGIPSKTQSFECVDDDSEENSSHVKASGKGNVDDIFDKKVHVSSLNIAISDKPYKRKKWDGCKLSNKLEDKLQNTFVDSAVLKVVPKFDVNTSTYQQILGHDDTANKPYSGKSEGSRQNFMHCFSKGSGKLNYFASGSIYSKFKNVPEEKSDGENMKSCRNSEKEKNKPDYKISSRDVSGNKVTASCSGTSDLFPKDKQTSEQFVPFENSWTLSNTENITPEKSNEYVENVVIPDILKDIRGSTFKETQVLPLDGFLNCCDFNEFSIHGDLIGLFVGSGGKIHIVVPKRKFRIEDKLSKCTNDPEYQEKLLLLAQIIETEQRISIKDTLRSYNSHVAGHRPDDGHFTKLDSSLKKNTAFVRKLKTFTGSQLENLLKEFLALNLTKYVSEVATALVEAKLKMIDVWPAVQLCNIFHGIYSEFSVHLLNNWQKILTIKKDEKIANAAKLRVDVRFYAELVNVGILTHKEGLPLMGNVLTMLTHSDKDDHLNINIILSFCRHCGDEYAGLVPRKMKELCEKYGVTLPQYKLLPKEKQRNVRALLKDYFNSMCRHLLKEHLELQSFVRQNKKILQTKGELSSERKEKLEVLQTSFDRIANVAQQFAEALDEDLPTLPEDDTLKSETLTLNGSSESEEGVLTASLWEDEETRRFYEYLPDMKVFLPSLQVRTADPEPQISEETLDAEFDAELSGENDQDEEIALAEMDEIEDTEPVGNPSNKILLDAFLTSLPNCINREMIDSAAVDFVMTLNSKHNRRKLVKTLFNVPRIRLDLLPFYARFVATLHPVVPDVATDLAQMLKQDFKYHIRKKDQMNIESKIKIVRFIGELVKFRMYSKIEGLYCVKVLVQDFTHHHIEMCCNLLESCGRFFFRHPDCHQRMKVYLDQMMRKKAVMALDSRYVTMIENAYYYVNPPESTQCVAKERPVEHEFIRKILYQMLMKSNTDKVLRLMRKLDWNIIDTQSYAVKCLTYAFKVKYFNIRCLASLLAGLATQQEAVGAQVVDGVLEDIRLGMEVNLPKYNQRRVAMIKYLGELYNYRMLESSNIFQVLYSLITFGVSWDPENPSPLDIPDNLFRIRLVCVLLETCGQYFISGTSKKKLDVFLVYFQHYFWFKFSASIWSTESPFPVGINFMFKDTITSLRPNIVLFTSYSEATEAVAKLKMEETSLFSQGDPSMKEESEKNYLSSTETNFPDEAVDSTSFLKKLEEDVAVDDEDDVNSGDNCDPEQDDDDEDDLTEPLSGDVDEADIDWSSNCDMLHLSEGDSQSQELNLPVESSVLSHGPKLLECPEDEDFLTAFDRMVSDNIQDRMRETVKPQQVDISVPLHIKGSSKKTYDQLREEEPAKSSVNFVLMLRKGHKQQYKNLEVPVNSEMALNLKNREEAERAEKEKVKRLTLDINERLEEEDYQEMLAQVQRPVVMNLNRERRHKYQHPKGAPDADLIFGPKKVR